MSAKTTLEMHFINITLLKFLEEDKHFNTNLVAKLKARQYEKFLKSISVQIKRTAARAA